MIIYVLHDCEDAKHQSLESRPWFLGVVGTFLFVVNDDHASVLHHYGDTGPQKFLGVTTIFRLSCTVMEI